MQEINEDATMLDEETVTNMIPIAHFKSNQLSKKEYYMDVSKAALHAIDGGSNPPEIEPYAQRTIFN